MSEHPYGNELTEWVEPRFALRTFIVRKGHLDSVVVSGGHWVDPESPDKAGDTCAAVCLGVSGDEASAHEAPGEDCKCGIYGAYSLSALRRQYGPQARWIVAVIQCEGTGMEGPVGLRAAKATVIAFWCPEPDDEHRDDIGLCLKQFPRARQYRNDLAMALVYRLGT